MKVKVSYQTAGGEQCLLDTELDTLIRLALERAGLTWYDQAVNLITGAREICFNFEE